MKQERLWIVYASLAVLAVAFAFFIVAPGVLGFPLDPNAGEVTRVLQIIVPVFIAYLSAATAFLLSPPQPDAVLAAEQRQLLRLLTRGPVYIAAGGMVLVTGVFWYTNRAGGPPGAGMSIDNYCWFLSALLGLLAATTGIVVGSIFPAAPNRQDPQNDPPQAPPPPAEPPPPQG